MKTNLNSQAQNIAIIGAGAVGVSAAHTLAEAGCKVSVFDQSAEVGGLASAFEVGDERLDCFYHHVFTSDKPLLDLISEYDMTHRMQWYETNNGIYANDRSFSFNGALDLLRFTPMSLSSRIRLGVLVLRAGYMKPGTNLDNITARDWIVKHAGQSAYDALWGPLLRSKFDIDAERISAVWLWHKMKLRATSREGGRELLGYMDGGFQSLFRQIRQELERSGHQFHMAEEVYGIEKSTAPVSLTRPSPLILRTANREETFDKVLFTPAPIHLTAFPSPLSMETTMKYARILYKANLCLVLELNEQISSRYWLTVTDNDIPFVVAVSHTTLVGLRGYGSHIVYLSRYLDQSDPLWDAPDEFIISRFLSGLKKMNPMFSDSDVKRTTLFRAAYAQPVVKTGYKQDIPDIRTEVPGLFLASMAHIYPEDRGLSYAVALGKRAAQLMLNEEEA